MPEKWKPILRWYALNVGLTRVLYAAESSNVKTHAILAQRQDIKQLLFRRLLSGSSAIVNIDKEN